MFDVALGAMTIVSAPLFSLLCKHNICLRDVLTLIEFVLITYCTRLVDLALDMGNGNATLLSDMGVMWLIWTLLMILTRDLYFYLTHRILHTKWLWVFHKQHHSHEINAVGAFSFSPVETVIQYGYVPLICATMPYHRLTMKVFVIIDHAHTVYVHCHDKSFSHIAHHKLPSCNFGLYFPCWDYMFGTLKKH